MQSLDTLYRHHLETKNQWMIGLLEGIGFSHLCRKILPSPLKNGFRNRAKFRVFRDKKVLSVEGTDPLDGSVEFEKSLWILPDWSQKVIRDLVAFVQKNSEDFLADGFEIQLAHGQKNVHTTFSVNRSITASYQDLAAKVLAEIPGVVGVAIPSQNLEVGETFLVHTIGDKNFRAHYDSFFQSNLYLTPDLVAHVDRMCKETAIREIIDLFCGVGLLSLSTAKKNTPIVGIDTNRMAIASAQFNADAMGFCSAKYFISPAERFVKHAEIGTKSSVFINPPRSGCTLSVINGITSQSVEHIIIVSCSLKTHILDLAEWDKKGYEIVSLKAFDMFPFTDFLETVTELRIKR
jgi:tRNA/tmRNA/rRNA uracil-C5-methylase (TrmA/RlmC/RlmD family)